MQLKLHARMWIYLEGIQCTHPAVKYQTHTINPQLGTKRNAYGTSPSSFVVRRCCGSMSSIYYFISPSTATPLFTMRCIDFSKYHFLPTPLSLLPFAVSFPFGTAHGFSLQFLSHFHFVSFCLILSHNRKALFYNLSFTRIDCVTQQRNLFYTNIYIIYALIINLRLFVSYEKINNVLL